MHGNARACKFTRTSCYIEAAALRLTTWRECRDPIYKFPLICRNAARRWTSREALSHPWLQRLKPRAGSDGDVPAGVVQRIQRFGSFNEFKRAALENIAERCLKQSMGLRSGAAGAASGLAAAAAADPTPGAPSSADASASDAPRTPAKHAAGVTRTDNVADVSSQAHAHGDAATAAGPVAPHAASAAVDAQGNVGGGGARGADVGAAAAQGAEVVADVVGTGSPGIGKAKRLLKHMMVTDGTVRHSPLDLLFQTKNAMGP